MKLLHSCLRRWLTGFVSLALFASGLAPLSAQTTSTGSVAGTVSDSGGYFVTGAEVRIQGTSLSTVTDRAGQFRIDGVAAGSQNVVVDYLGHKPAIEPVEVGAGSTANLGVVLKSDVLVLETYKVESIRQGQSRAINQQRSANTIKNIISADAIGNLPDRTIGEALGRLPGVNVVDDSKASIRGTAAQYNSVTLDGDRITTPGDQALGTATNQDTRAVDLSLIPSEMVGGIEVIKALTADMDADSFGGTINLVTRSAFDLKQRSINGKFEYIANDFQNKDGFAGSITYMDVLNKARTFGVSATLTYRDEDRWSNSYEITYYDPNAIPVGNSGSGTAGPIAAVGEQGVNEFDYRLNFKNVKKLGGTLNFDWKVSDNTELHWRTFYENSKTEGGRFRNRARALSRWNANSTATSQSGAQIRFVNLNQEDHSDIDVLRLGLEGKTKLTDGTLDYGIRLGDSGTDADTARYIFEFPGNTERRAYSWTLDRTNPQLPRFTMTQIATNADGLTNGLADRKLTTIRLGTGRDHEADLSGNVDYSFESDLGARRIEWKVGTKLRSKERTSRPFIRDYAPPASAIPNFSQFTINNNPRDLFEGTMASMGPYVSLAEVLNLYKGNSAAWTAPTGDEIIRVEARKYNVSEDVGAGYAMGSTKFGKLEVIAGLRWEQTKTGYTWLADPAGPSSGSKSYDNLYPSLLFNYRLNDSLVFRAAFTNTVARPNYGDLIPYRVLADTQAESGNGGLDPTDFPETNKVFLGNANLKAQQSRNYDLSLEYYIKPAGVLSVALFKKDLKDLIYRSQFKDPALPTTIFFQDRNGSSGKVDGVEISWQQALTFLPGPLDGLGVNINATFTKGSSVLQELTPGTSTYHDFTVDFLPEQPKRVYNVQLWWEKYGFTARVAMNYVGEFVRTSGGLTSFSVNNDATRWDASLAYRFTKNFTLYVEGKNLTNENESWYATTPTRPEDYTFNGMTINGGVKFRF